MTRFFDSRYVNLEQRYVSTCVGAGSGGGGEARIIKAIRWGACLDIYMSSADSILCIFSDESTGSFIWLRRHIYMSYVNPLNAELNPISHLLVLLGDLTFMSPCIVSIFQIPIYVQQDATLHSLCISGNCSTCFVWYFHPSSGANTTVSTASGICHTVTAICRYRGRVGTGSNSSVMNGTLVI
jgi:hypothetical protein